MTESQKETIRWMLDLPMSERRRFADGRLWKIQDALKRRGYTCAEIHKSLFGLFRLFISADHWFSEEEYDFLQSITGFFYTYDEFHKLTDHGRDRDYLYSTMDWLHNIDEQLFSDIFTFGAYIMTSDGPLTDDELKLCDIIQAYRPH